MQQSLRQLIENCRCIAIIGMEKNTGKTTVLNRILSAKPALDSVAVTSIGFDGEEIDRVTGTNKPVIFVGRGTLVATAGSLLACCDTTREILACTGIHTALGEVVVFRALSDGYIRLAGPSITSQMKDLVDILRALGAKKVFIDGAAARKSSAAIDAADACILATGGALSPSIEEVANQTAFSAKLLTLPETSLPPKVLAEFEAVAQNGFDQWSESPENLCIALHEDSDPIILGSSLDDSTIDRAADNSVNCWLFFKGLLSCRFAELFLQKTRMLTGLKIVAGNGTNFFLRLEQFNEFMRRGASFEVLHSGKLKAITINPTSPAGWSLDSAKLKQKLKQLTSVPVYDVISDDIQENLHE
ncbi:MAG: hypothetical protein Kow0029_24510 [Candidatus Rifleibacteriota bacterium]